MHDQLLFVKHYIILFFFVPAFFSDFDLDRYVLSIFYLKLFVVGQDVDEDVCISPIGDFNRVRTGVLACVLTYGANIRLFIARILREQDRIWRYADMQLYTMRPFWFDDWLSQVIKYS